MGVVSQLPRVRRPPLVIAALAGYPLAAAVLLALKRTGLPPGLVLAGFLVVLVVLVIGPLTVLYRYTRGRIDGRGAQLDERQLSLTVQAYAAAHRVLTGILIAAALAVAIYLAGGRTVTLDAVTATPALLWVIVYLPALPMLMLSWIEAEPPADD